MAEYNFREIEKKWQDYWEKNDVYKVPDQASGKPKFYVLDMFPYPSGAGLHVGHPLGYIASDIIARYKRNKGYNVLHPMGFDSFGLPAEQYAVETGQDPSVTTEQNIKKYKSQLKNIGFSYDWSREVRTSDPSYYKWTQWIFLQLFKHWYNHNTGQAEPIDTLIKEFEQNGNNNVNAACHETETFSAEEWNNKSEQEKQALLQNYRLAYLSEATVNWCPALGTVLANEEVKEGVSERGGHPVEKKKMWQWSLRITAYAERLLEGLDALEWPESVKEMQRNWIGKSFGADIYFKTTEKELPIKVFTTRPDTTFGVTFMAIAPEHERVTELTTPAQKAEVEQYIEKIQARSERERMSDVETVSGAFTGTYVTNPFTGEQIPVWVADYVLAGYGTGIIMAVPSSDERDYKFARHFNIPIVKVQEGEGTDIFKDDFDPEKGTMINSGFLNGLPVEEAKQKAIEYVEQEGIGKAKINYKLRDAVFSRQRYWGEPFPIYYKDGIAYPLPEDRLPLELPKIETFKPTEEGDPPLGRAENWHTAEGYPLELNTMPGWAGSSWYYLRYMDPHNNKELVNKDIEEYWRTVDFYFGGAEHATGHLLYSRFWYKFLGDIGVVSDNEPFKRMINQGMIQGISSFAYRINGTNTFVSYNLKDQYDTTPVYVDINLVDANGVMDTEGFKQWRSDLNDADFILENGQYICGTEVEKMSKSKHNVINPDDVIEKYGADTLRMYEMFLGPLEHSKPWKTHGIDGVFKFIRKFWNLFHDKQGNFSVSDEEPSGDELKILHKTIKKVEEDIEECSFNTAVSSFMICANELTSNGCNKRAILEPLTVLLTPFAPHITEELWQLLGNEGSIVDAPFPEWKEEHIKEDAFEYPVSVNGKVRAKITLPVDTPQEKVEEEVLKLEQIQKWTGGQQPKKVIVVPNKIVNLVV